MHNHVGFQQWSCICWMSKCSLKTPYSILSLWSGGAEITLWSDQAQPSRFYLDRSTGLPTSLALTYCSRALPDVLLALKPFQDRSHFCCFVCIRRLFLSYMSKWSTFFAFITGSTFATVRSKFKSRVKHIIMSLYAHLLAWKTAK